MKTVFLLATMFLLVIMFLCGCSHVVKGQDRDYYYADDGYHTNKTSEEMDHDYYDCHKIGLAAPVTYNPITVESHCMRHRGYVWK